jgi:signal recognition particle receptor subunit alpha
LNQWVERNGKDRGVKIELFEKGYGKDAADVAAQAVKFADAQGFDVVLIDTAGRRHNDQALMGSLGKVNYFIYPFLLVLLVQFAKQAKPDKILMVAEALVGTDSVSQARSFTNALTTANRRLDGFIISKMDTVEDLVGTVVSMVYSTGVPVWYLGVGQMYGDLRDFKVHWVVSKLMKA